MRVIKIRKPKRKKKQSYEKTLQNAILQYLASRGIFAWRQNTGAIKIEDRFLRFGALGCPDILGLLPNGKMLAIEVKSPKGKLTLAQKSFLEAIVKNGGIAIVAKRFQDVECQLPCP